LLAAYCLLLIDMYQKHTFENGLRLLTIPMPGAKSVTAMILVGVGSRYEEKNINGISHFLEHMAFKGTEKRPNAMAIASTIDGIGGEFNAFTSKDHTGYYVKAASKHLPLLLDVLSDMLLHSKFDEKEIEKEKGVIIEEINMYEDTPMRKISDLWENLLYGDTKLGRDIAGRKEVIRSVKREDFVGYIDRFYGPKNTIVVLAGGIEENTQMVGDYLGGWKSKEIVAAEKVDDKQDKPGLLVHFKDTKQAHLCLGVRGYNYFHPDRFSLAVLSVVLGGGMSSRLFSEVREKRGLAYYVRASVEKYTDVGSFVVQAGVDVNRIEDAVKVSLEQLNKVANEEVKSEELNKAKESIKGHMALDLEDSRDLAATFGVSDLLEGKIRTYEQVCEEIDKVQKEDLLRVGKDIFKTEKLNLAIIGPYKQSEVFRKILTL
jgi:predicted Zn-dependent peptidase